jgi:hypothetical protein
VATSDNFGSRGERPSHPELLDWLAARFVAGGWSVKALHRQILLSNAYQMAGTPNAQAAQNDPGNRLLWRFPRRRLEAEELRDSLLAVSGQLDRSIGGGETIEVVVKVAEVNDAKRGFFVNTVTSNHAVYLTPRRTLYLPVIRNALPDVLALFDAADPNAVAAVRNDTTVPSQALFMLNNPLVRDQAALWAKALLADGKASDADRVKRAYGTALGRPPTTEEVSEAIGFLDTYAARSKEKQPQEARQTAWQSYCQLLFCMNEFLYVD